jgi:hypothetical protein
MFAPKYRLLLNITLERLGSASLPRSITCVMMFVEGLIAKNPIEPGGPN